MAVSQPYPANTGYAGLKDFHADSSDFNGVSFAVRRMLDRASTSTLVKIVGVTNAGGVSAVGYVDVQPLVNQVDGAGNATPHGTIHHLPYVRLQGGSNAIILDPQVNDIGIAIFASHDLSSVKATGAQANPGSKRRFSMADGLYVGGVLNGAPIQYIAFTAAGININTPHALTFLANNAVLDASGNLAVIGEVIAGANGADQVGLQTHRHGVGSPAAGTVAPTAGT